ncbi:PREDICTED: CST complex subunit TEN1 isoform X1 [Myotis brandtii]|uniref:CST complex subunit TEN1 isoform X1 n=1 Tax=Myotis brandtii TaxID=109478 RepID=UPI000703F339|nr:PREDICTED: CST complex subunit TEN1 isoform X1 [Myotis brandtii]XP_005884306.2 PREDICTED: CST complex subunit TEN1 isoform X1 [Myotis brandtii]XP_005884307.2 PREDICTED: CST complex subunit TEN1 isoform X1 [Myotis brandtii]XP_005884308.2 PREDICTED: CST complex subunit TEN1 isoform X1 [Myotis brandtii]
MTLPKPGIYYFPWEVSAGQAPDGGALRTFGRLSLYDMTESRATLTAQHASEQHQVLVCTKLVEPFQAQVGSLYLVLGELEQQKGHPVFQTSSPSPVGGWHLRCPALCLLPGLRPVSKGAGRAGRPAETSNPEPL